MVFIWVDTSYTLHARTYTHTLTHSLTFTFQCHANGRCSCPDSVDSFHYWWCEGRVAHNVWSVAHADSFSLIYHLQIHAFVSPFTYIIKHLSIPLSSRLRCPDGTASICNVHWLAARRVSVGMGGRHIRTKCVTFLVLDCMSGVCVCVCVCVYVCVCVCVCMCEREKENVQKIMCLLC